MLATDARLFLTSLDSGRPQPISATEKARALDSLPDNGEVLNIDAGGRAKLASLSAVLRLNQRDAVYEIKVIDLPQAGAVLYARAVILISNRTLRLVKTDELQALVAHEIGHEYVWVEYERARALHDGHRMRQLELLCDAIAIVTLRRLGLDPSRLGTGLEKIVRFNRQQLGHADNEGSYPEIAERLAFARAVIAWAAEADGRR